MSLDGDTIDVVCPFCDRMWTEPTPTDDETTYQCLNCQTTWTHSRPKPKRRRTILIGSAKDWERIEETQKIVTKF